MTDDWPKLVKTATLGTNRAAPPDTAHSDVLPERSDAALALLDRAAVESARRLAGRTTLTAPTTPTPPAPEEPTLPANDRASALLEAVLTEKPLVHAWLRACTAAGRHLPPRILTDILDLTTNDADIRSLVRPVLGTRGIWLARQHPQWRFALPAAIPDEDTWLAATPAVRAELYRAAFDANPNDARTFFRTRFPVERAETQERLLNVLAEHLTDADVTLADVLEAALEARSTSVRSLALATLARLPGTDFQARMEARLRALVTVNEPKSTLNAYAPDENTKRDGLPDEPVKPRDALRALLPLMHPATVTRVLGPEATLVVRRAVQLGVLDALVETHANAPGGELTYALRDTRREELSHELLPYLPLPDREAHALTWLADTPDWRNVSRSALPSLPGPWSSRVSDAVLRALAATALLQDQPGDYRRRWSWQTQVDHAASNVDPTSPLPALPTDAAEDARTTWAHLERTLRLRRDILLAFDLKEPV